MNEKLEIITFGCRLNSYETEVIRSRAREAKLSNAVIINTCAVTSEAERQARQAIRRARKNSPNAEIIVSGCAAQINPSDWANMPEVNRVIGNQEKLEAVSFISETEHPKIKVNDIMSVNEQAGHLLSSFEGKARAYVQVQQGCDHRCTFCIIPFGRGNSRSIPLGDLVNEAKRLVANGYQELVLTGVDLTSYGHDLPGQPSLGQAVRRLLAAIPSLPRLRLSSLDPSEIDPDLELLIANESRLMPHLHLSIQSGSDLILKRMKRRHLRTDVIDLTKKLRKLRPEIVFGADLIAGFPTETSKMFKHTIDIIKEAELTWLHVFPYSPRPNTPAARMPQVAKNIRRERSAELRKIGEVTASNHLNSYVGFDLAVLVEKQGMGRTESYAKVSIDGNPAEGTIVNTHILRSDGSKLYGQIV